MISVIIPTKNNADTLPDLLASIDRQEEPVDEVIVVDNHSTDGTPELARAAGAHVLTVGPERSAQRNAGIVAARNRYCLLLDSDMLLSKNVTKECLRRAPEGASMVVIPEDSFGEGYWAQCKWLERRCYHHEGLVEAARFFERSLLSRISGYDEDLLGFEDWDLHNRALEAGGISARVDALILHNEGRFTLRRSLQKKGYYASHIGTYRAKHPRLAAKQLHPLVRLRAFARNLPLLARHPHLTVGMLLMKLLEVGSAYAAAPAEKPPIPKGAHHA